MELPKDYYFCSACGVIPQNASEEKTVGRHASGLLAGDTNWKTWLSHVSRGAVEDKMEREGDNKEHPESMLWVRHFFSILRDEDEEGGGQNYFLLLLLQLVGLGMVHGTHTLASFHATGGGKGKLEKLLRWYAELIDKRHGSLGTALRSPEGESYASPLHSTSSYNQFRMWFEGPDLLRDLIVESVSGLEMTAWWRDISAEELWKLQQLKKLPALGGCGADPTAAEHPPWRAEGARTTTSSGGAEPPATTGDATSSVPQGGRPP